MDDAARRNLMHAARNLRAARSRLHDALESAGAAARDALAEGQTEVEVAKQLGVNRLTVRRWAGK